MVAGLIVRRIVKPPAVLSQSTSREPSRSRPLYSNSPKTLLLVAAPFVSRGMPKGNLLTITAA